MEKHEINTKPKAYSYVRWSSPQQTNGDSFRRQTEAAQAYCERNGLELADLVYTDAGVSAARGKNADIGMLGKFIEAVDRGEIARGSYLLIEKLDRLSRDNIRNARNLFESLVLDKRINVVTLSPERLYTAETFDLTDMIISLLEQSQAGAFSQNLSDRVGKAWAAKRKKAREQGIPTTARCPGWLRLNKKTKEFEVIPERVKIVQYIFQLALDGHGSMGIAKRLNTEKVDTFSSPGTGVRKAANWHQNYIRKILSTRAVLGEFQPMRRAKKFEVTRISDGREVIKGYFPAVIDENAFNRVRGMKTRISGKGSNQIRNAFGGLVYCGTCGKAKMYFVNKGRQGGQYLSCDGRRRRTHECTATSVRYDKVFEAVIGYIRSNVTSIQDLCGQTTTQNKSGKLREAIAAIEGEISESEKSIDRLLDSLERIQSGRTEQRIADLEAKLKSLEEQKTQLEMELHEASNGRNKATELAEAADALVIDTRGMTVEQIENALKDPIAKMNARLKDMVERIEIRNGEGGKVKIRIKFKAGEANRVVDLESKAKSASTKRGTLKVVRNDDALSPFQLGEVVEPSQVIEAITEADRAARARKRRKAVNP